MSINSDDWPGVLLAGDRFRIVLNRAATRLVVQQSEQRTSGRRWSPVILPDDQTKWPKLISSDVQGMAELIEEWRQPWRVLARLAAAQRVAVLPPLRCREWLASDYGGVISSDANMRVVVDPTGNLFALQWLPPKKFEAGTDAAWITQFVADSRDDLKAWLADKAFEKGRKGEPDRSAVMERAAALLAAVPERADRGPWAVVPTVPAFADVFEMS